MLLLVLDPSSTSPAIAVGASDPRAVSAIAASTWARYSATSPTPGSGQQPAVRSRVPGTDPLVVGVEQEAEVGVEAR